MATRDEAIKLAFVEGFKQGHCEADPSYKDTWRELRAEQAFVHWKIDNAGILCQPDLEARVRELEQAWERRESYEQEQRERS